MDDQRAVRVAETFEQVWKQSWLSIDHGRSAQVAPDDPSGTLDDSLDAPLNVREVPPPPRETVLEWVKETYEQSGETGRPVR